MAAGRTAQVKPYVVQDRPPTPADLELAEYTADMIEQLEQMYKRMGRVRTASLLRAALKSSQSDMADLRKK
jgi:hypothetical protein